MKLVVWLPGPRITYLRTTVRAARALNIGRRTATIRNHGCEDTGRIEEVTYLCGHDARNECFMESKGRQTGKSSYLSRYGSCKVIGVQLQKFHGSEDTNIVDTSSQLVVIDVCGCQQEQVR